MDPTCVLRKHSHFAKLLKLHSRECHPGDVLFAASVCQIAPCLPSAAGEYISYFWVQEEKCRRERRGKMHTNKEEEEYTTKSPPLDRRPIHCIYNMTGSSESLHLRLTRAPQGRLFSSSPSGLGQAARRGGERQEAMARRAWRKERPTVNRICRFLLGPLKGWIAPKACKIAWGA